MNTTLSRPLKDSGIASIGQIPADWDVVAARRHLRLVARAVGKRAHEYDLLSLTKQGVILRDISENKGKFPASFDTYQEVRPGDLVLCLFDIDETPRTVGLSPLKGMVTGAYSVFASSVEWYRNYLYLLLLHLDDAKGLKPYYSGLRKTIRPPEFQSIKFPVPPESEARNICRYVDRETARIDALIEKKTRFIELLKEKRQALITQAVTKGMDPTVPMKDSGVEWIGEVPAHWRQPPSYAHFKAKKGSDAARLTKEFCLLNPGPYAVYSGQTENQGVIGRIDRYEFDLEAPAILTTTVGAKAMSVSWTETQFSLSQNCMLLLPDRDCHSRYYLYFFECLFSAFRALIPDHMQPSFRMEDFYGMKILLPTLNEQAVIAEHLDVQMSRIENLVRVTTRSIDLLKERRSALITAAVTGQIDLREEE